MKVASMSQTSAAVGNALTERDPNGDKQRLVNLEMMDLADRHGLPLLMTTDAHMVSQDKKFCQDILLQNGNPDGWRFTRPYYQMTAEEAWNKWSGEMDLAEYEREFSEAVANNEKLVDMVGKIEVEHKVRLPSVSVPEDIRARYPDSSVDRNMAVVSRLIRMHGRLPEGPRREEYLDRLDEEIEVIAHNGIIDLLPYFIFVEGMCRMARDAGQVCGPGRGSAAGSLLSYLLKITHLDPIEWDLSFYRFLSLGRIRRGKLPDIDLDFADPGWVSDAMKARLGDRFVRICTYGTIKGRSAIREVARVVMSTQTDPQAAAEVDEVAKTLPYIPQGVEDGKGWIFGFRDEMDVHHPGEIDRNPVIRDFFEKHPDVRRGVEDVLGIPKSIGRHAAAYAAADVPIPEIVPICRVGGEECTQNPMGPIEDMGLIKMDILGLNTLKDIGGCIDWVRGLRGIEIDPYDVPLDDEGTWKAFEEGRTETVFQFNKAIGVDLSRRFRPRSVMDLAQMTAAGRPGVMEALMPDGETKMVDQWVGVRSGERNPSYVHPSVRPILESTGGVCLFQEQISAMFMVACGYSEEDADEIREIVGKKKKDRMDALLPEIRRRLSESGWSEAQSESFISLCIAASSYSFNKAHSLVYSYLGYLCQYLKENYPVEWWASVLQNSSKDDLKQNARYCSKYITPPDVMSSGVDVFVADRTGRSDRGRIVFPLSMVHGIRTAAEAVVDARPFSTLEEMYSKVDRKRVNKRVFSALIWSGAMDSMFGLGESSGGIMGRNAIYSRYLEIKRDKEPFRPLSRIEIMLRQGEAFPMIEPDYTGWISEKVGRNVTCVSTVPHRADGSRGTMGGVVREIRRIVTKKGDEMSFMKVTNSDSTVEVTRFPDVHRETNDLVGEGDLVAVRGRIQDWNGKRSLIADEVIPIRKQKEEKK